MVAPRLHNSEIFQINLLTIQEVAEWAKASTKTLHRWISDEKIPAIRLGKRTYRIPEKAVIDYLKSTGYEDRRGIYPEHETLPDRTMYQSRSSTGVEIFGNCVFPQPRMAQVFRHAFSRFFHKCRPGVLWLPED